MSKAAEAFRTISEVADELDVQKHVLRFWEARFPQVRPMKRGGGRRYYRPEDMELLRGIRHLLHAEGYTIKGVQKICASRASITSRSTGACRTSRCALRVALRSLTHACCLRMCRPSVRDRKVVAASQLPVAQDHAVAPVP